MQKRIITSFVLIGILALVAIINNKILTTLFISIITILAMQEAKKLFKTEDKIFYLLSILTLFSVFINPIFLAVIGILSVLSYIAFYQKDLSLSAISFYPFLPLMLLISLYQKTSMGIILWLILIVALTDSIAYIVGKSFGKKFFKFTFKASPNKSLEGLIGGVVVSTIISSLVGLYFFDFFNSLIISFIVSITSVFGDLFESFLKRRVGIKDSGNILPGHGGVLDRIDGYLFSAPLMWAILIW